MADAVVVPLVACSPEWSLPVSDQRDDDLTLALRLFFFSPTCADDSHSCFMRVLSYWSCAPAPAP